LSGLPPVTDPNVLVGTSTADDAAVYRVSDELALIQTVDFFTPIVDEPYWFGAISAANSVSDVYAMGGRPVMAMNIVGFPRDSPEAPLSALAEILQGGADKAKEAGFDIIGGHTIDDKEPKYGLAVTGFVHPDRIWRNVGVRPGDRLILTKPLGMGIITTALRHQVVTDDIMAPALELMAMLNKRAAEEGQKVDVHACTDVTGFGLLGHLREMLAEGDVSARLSMSEIPVLPGTRDLAAAGQVPGGTHRNKASLDAVASYAEGVSETERLILCDAQTSGGLLFSVTPDDAKRLMAALVAADIPATDFGEVLAGAAGTIDVVR
jgi:selenide,water dikinase